MPVDVVVVATGAARDAPEIPGAQLPQVFDGATLKALLLGEPHPALKHKLPAWQFVMVAMAQRTGLLSRIGWVRRLSHLWMPLGRRVLIIGGGPGIG